MPPKKRYWLQILLVTVVLMATAGLLFGLFYSGKYPPQIATPMKGDFPIRQN